MGGTVVTDTATWTIGSISGSPARAGDPPPAGARASRVSFTQDGAAARDAAPSRA